MPAKSTMLPMIGAMENLVACRIGMATNVVARVQELKNQGIVPQTAAYRTLDSGLTYSEANAREASRRQAYGVLRVRILGLGNDACDRQIDALLTELNTTGTVFPGTEMRMVYEVDGAPESAQPVSPKISRGQEV